MKVGFRMAGVLLTDRPLSFRQKVLRHFGFFWVVLSFLTITYAVYYFHGTSYRSEVNSVAQMTRIILQVGDCLAHIYCCCLLRKHDADLAEFVRGSRFKVWKFLRLLRFLAVFATLIRGTLIAIKYSYSPQGQWLIRMVVHIVFSPLKIVYHLSMVVYLMTMKGLCDEVDHFCTSLTAEIRQKGILDVCAVCREAISFKYVLRAKVRRINAVFSVPILVLYFKLFSYCLIFIYVAVINRSVQRRSLEAALYMGSGIHSTVEIIAMSSTTMFFIQKLRQASDNLTNLALNYSMTDITLLSEVRRILDFDPTRDAVRVLESFVLCKSTTVKFFVGMISCVSIILQFDVNFTDALDKLDV